MNGICDCCGQNVRWHLSENPQTRTGASGRFINARTADTAADTSWGKATGQSDMEHLPAHIALPDVRPMPRARGNRTARRRPTMSDMCADRARQFYRQLGPPVDVTAVREVGWRKLASGATTFVVDFATVQTTEQITIEAAPTCPKCGETMVKRSGKLGSFWGCVDYPECRGTRPG